MNNTIFLGYLAWCFICFVAIAYTRYGEGWRHAKDQRVLFTPPWTLRFAAFSLALLGPATFLVVRDESMFNCSILLSLFSSIGLTRAVGVQEFSADVAIGTYVTRRGLPGFASKKSGRLDELSGVQIRRGAQYSVFITKPGDKKWGGFQIGAFNSRIRAIAAAERVAEDLHIPLLPSLS